MDPLACTVCLNRFHDPDFIPKALECGHSFCEHCVKDFLSSTPRECPTCKQEITRTEHPTNLSALKLLDFYKKDSKLAASLGTLDCLKEIDEVKLKAEKKIEKLTGEIKDRETLEKKIREQIAEKQKMIESLQNGLKQLELLEEKRVKDVDTKEALKVISQLKDLEDDGASAVPGVSRPVHNSSSQQQGGSRTSKQKKSENGSTSQTQIPEPPSRRYVGEVFFHIQTASSETETMIMIKLVPNPRTAQFAHLCTGECGPCYKGTTMNDKRYENWGWGSLLFRADNYMEDGRKGRGAIEDFSGSYVESEYRAGEVVIIAYNDGSFSVVKLTSIRNLSSIIGVVSSPGASILEGFPRGPLKISETGICIGL